MPAFYPLIPSPGFLVINFYILIVLGLNSISLPITNLYCNNLGYSVSYCLTHIRIIFLLPTLPQIYEKVCISKHLDLVLHDFLYLHQKLTCLDVAEEAVLLCFVIQISMFQADLLPGYKKKYAYLGTSKSNTWEF